MLSRLRSVLEMAEIHHSLHPCFLVDPPCAAIYVKEHELKHVGDAIGRALCQHDGQVDEPIASPKVAEYGGDWYVLYWPDVPWI